MISSALESEVWKPQTSGPSWVDWKNISSQWSLPETSSMQQRQPHHPQGLQVTWKAGWSLAPTCAPIYCKDSPHNLVFRWLWVVCVNFELELHTQRLSSILWLTSSIFVSRPCIKSKCHMSHTTAYRSSPTERKLKSLMHQSGFQVFVLPEKLEGALTEQTSMVPWSWNNSLWEEFKMHCLYLLYALCTVCFVSLKQAYQTEDKPSSACLFLSFLCISCFSCSWGKEWQSWNVHL